MSGRNTIGLNSYPSSFPPLFSLFALSVAFANWMGRGKGNLLKVGGEGRTSWYGSIFSLFGTVSRWKGKRRWKARHLYRNCSASPADSSILSRSFSPVNPRSYSSIVLIMSHRGRLDLPQCVFHPIWFQKSSNRSLLRPWYDGLNHDMLSFYALHFILSTGHLIRQITSIKWTRRGSLHIRSYLAYIASGSLNPSGWQGTELTHSLTCYSNANAFFPQGTPLTGDQI